MFSDSIVAKAPEFSFLLVLQ